MDNELEVNDKAMGSMAQFRVPMNPKNTPILPPNCKPVNTNPDHKAGAVSAEMYGLGRGKDGAI